VEAVGAERGPLAAVAHEVGDPLRGVGAHQADLGAALLAEQVEEALQGLLVPADPRPHQAPGVVVHHDHQVAVAALVADLIDPDAPQAIERVVGGSAVCHHPVDDRSHGAPGDAKELGDGGPGGVGDEPGGQIVEVPGVAGPVAGPRDLGHGGAVGGAVDAGGVRLQEAAHRAEVDGPPPPPALAAIVQRGHLSAPAAPALRVPPGPHVGDHRVLPLVDLHPFDHRGPVDTEHPTPYRGTEHAASSPRWWTLDSPEA